MRDAGLASPSSELFKYIYTELHEKYRETTINYSQVGKMDFDFSNRDKLIDFYTFIRKGFLSVGYPLFEKLKQDLVSDVISPSDFADTFNLTLADTLIIKALFRKEQVHATK